MGVFTRMMEGLSAGADRKTVMIDELPRAQWLLADRGYGVDWFRDALEEKGIKPCIPGRKSRNEPIKYDKRRYRRRTGSRSCSAA